MLRRHRLFLHFLAISLAVSITLSASVPCRANVTIATVPIGNPGNANDPATGNLYGGVAYNYAIDKYDVTVGQYTAFLNAVAATDAYGLYNPSMATDLNIAGISQSGVSGSYMYSVIGSANHPVTYVSWGDAARFSNWLNNGQPTGGESLATTEAGAYTLNGATTNAALNAASRNAGAKWFIPSESEWYKAAYYDPVAGRYWNYATGTDVAPTSASPGGTPNTANYYDSITGYGVTGSTSYGNSQNYLTDVGAYTASASPYGTFDQGGDVFEWNEALTGGSFRGVRGGSWVGGSSLLLASYRDSLDAPTNEFINTGFRVAQVPEPSTAALAVLACGLMVWQTKRTNRSWTSSKIHARSNSGFGQVRTVRSSSRPLCAMKFSTTGDTGGFSPRRGVRAVRTPGRLLAWIWSIVGTVAFAASPNSTPDLRIVALSGQSAGAVGGTLSGLDVPSDQSARRRRFHGIDDCNTWRDRTRRRRIHRHGERTQLDHPHWTYGARSNHSATVVVPSAHCHRRVRVGQRKKCRRPVNTV